MIVFANLISFESPAKDFDHFALEIAQKVNLFREVWTLNPEAKFFGGTSRDFLYFVLKNDPDELRKRRSIDIREILGFESDVDVISESEIPLHAENYGIRKIDRIDPERFDPETDEGQNEILQGYIPLEKLQLGKDSITTPPIFKFDALQDLEKNQISVFPSSPEKFWKSLYAQQGENHPLLLAVRYIRIVAMDYAHRVGLERPHLAELLKRIPKKEQTWLKATISAAAIDKDRRLSNAVNSERFRRWLRGSLMKAFRSYTNPTAAHLLYEHFGFHAVVEKYEAILKSKRIKLDNNNSIRLNQFLYRKSRDDSQIRRNWKKMGLKPENVFQQISKYFPDGKLYHGTRSEEGFRSILFQGALPSEDGSAGAGLYGTNLDDEDFCIRWGGASDRLVALKLSPQTRLVDITKGTGEKLWHAWGTRNVGGSIEDFAEDFGIDLIAYPYEPQAFVLKNAEVIQKTEGIYRKLMSFHDLERMILKCKSKDCLPQAIDTLLLNSLATDEFSQLWDLLPKGKRDRALLNIIREDREKAYKILSLLKEWALSIWREINRDVDLAGSHTDLLYAMHSPQNFPDFIWKKVRIYFERMNVRVNPRIFDRAFLSLVASRSVWPQSLWRIYLKKALPIVKKSQVLIFPPRQDWPLAYWKMLPQFLFATEFNAHQLREEVLKQRELPEAFWKATINLFEKGKISEYMSFRIFLNDLKVWPQSLWKRIPHWLDTDVGIARVTFSESLQYQKDWPQNIWDSVMKQIGNRKNRQRTHFISLLESRESIPSFAWPTLLKVLKDKDLFATGALVRSLKSLESAPPEFISELAQSAQIEDTNTRESVRLLLTALKRKPDPSCKRSLAQAAR